MEHTETPKQKKTSYAVTLGLTTSVQMCHFTVFDVSVAPTSRKPLHGSWWELKHMTDSDLLAIFSSCNDNALRVTSGFEGGQHCFALQWIFCQHLLAVLSDHLSHQRLPHGLMGRHSRVRRLRLTNSTFNLNKLGDSHFCIQHFFSDSFAEEKYWRCHLTVTLMSYCSRIMIRYTAD